jgi:hypothetical protein
MEEDREYYNQIMRDLDIERITENFNKQNEKRYGHHLTYNKPTYTIQPVFTNVTDVNLEILRHLDDESLINLCFSNKEILKICNQDKDLTFRLKNMNVDINAYFSNIESKNINNLIDTNIFNVCQGSEYNRELLRELKTKILEKDFVDKKFTKVIGNPAAPIKIRNITLCHNKEDVGICYTENNKKYLLTDNIRYTEYGTPALIFKNAFYTR